MQAGFAFHRCVFVFLLSLGVLGCGSTPQRDASEQLLTSNAVDRSVAQLDFRALSGKTVYFDTTYLKNIKGVGFVNAEYITSSLRQQLVAARCLLQDKKEEAEYVVEARIGALGTDRHEVTYGMPANNFLNAASSLVPNSPALPTLPELALAKRNEQLAAAKIGAFAYHRETGEPVWQSGIVPIRSTAKDTWVLGAGPFQRGDIYEGGTHFAGTRLGFSLRMNETKANAQPLVDYNKAAFFNPILHQKQNPEEKETDKDKGNEKSPAETPENIAAKPEQTAARAKPATKTSSAEKAAPPATAEKAPAPAKTSNTASTPPNGKISLDPESWQSQGLRLRFRFDQPPPVNFDPPTEAGTPKLFRLDPLE